MNSIDNLFTDSFNAFSFFENFLKKEEGTDEEAQKDWAYLKLRKNAIIAGFLSLGKKDGSQKEEGNTAETGNRCIRHMLRKFWEKNSVQLSDYFEIIMCTLKAFSPSVTKNEKGSYPRANVDDTITEWLDHGVSRLIGNVRKEFSPTGPFFEVLVNSAQIKGQTIITPFCARILENKEIALERGKTLKEMEYTPIKTAYYVFYSSLLTTPSAFIENYKKQHNEEPGPVGLRLLKGLEYVNLQKMKAQVTGNCWIKQRKRCVLLSFYLEILTQRPEITIEKAWELAKKLYSKWKNSSYEEIQSMMQAKDVSSDLIPLAKKKIDYLKGKKP